MRTFMEAVYIALSGISIIFLLLMFRWVNARLMRVENFIDDAIEEDYVPYKDE